MICKKFECTDRHDEVCCFECPDFAECGFPCYHAFVKEFTKENYKLNCEYYKSEEVWSWNEMDNENWSHGAFDSREEAIEDALSDIENVKRILCTDTPTIYLGKCEYIPLRTDLDPDRAMEYLDEAYCNDSGCDYYIYEGVTDEQRQWLEDKLSDVMIEFHKMIGLKPCWFRVVEQEKIDLCKYQKEKTNECK